ncbi:MAG: hypothetical protein K9N47_23765 [Prosthecobacter sp.]|uniref:hypothetical protein n=1 Tax=Prosthecobacter sp. TaxID=1965333 RepID=UPI00261404BC|nr:hypothetical protein [Prosthecobacter sp.]MCF7789163.1 hypothetical protein [Prosthecobacter sp.]
MKTHSSLLAFLVVFGLGMFASARASDYATNPSFNHPMAGLRPAKDFRGRYPTLTKSMRAGHVRSVTPENVVSYGHPSIGKYNNEIYWLVPVTFYTAGPDTSYQQISMDGRPLPYVSRARYSATQFSSVVYACVRGGRVEHWIYKLSKTPVR